MEYRTFGRTGWRVSEIGFGGWQLGGTWGYVDEKESIDTLLYAFENGINFVDTAQAYGSGQSEKIMGKALKEWKGEKIYVATKVTPLTEHLPKLELDKNPSIQGRYPAQHIRKSVEGSLKRLGVDCLDLLQLHLWIEDGLTNLEWMETLNALRIEGKIDKVGVSLADIRLHQGITLAKFGLVDSIQVMFNMFEQEPIDSLFPKGSKNGIGFLARVPFNSGALTGTWNEHTYSQWAKGDKRNYMYRGKRFAETLRRIDALKSVCEPYYKNLAEAALKFALHPGEVSCVIPGMRNRKEVDLNIAISDGKTFEEDLLETIKSHRWKHEFY
jgi:aryl-alcohol dehydrogenase-like predicted oxidoreductase